MGSGMKSLAKETVIYGISSIVARFLNWFLFPMYSYVMTTQSEVGVISNLYAWVALLLVVLTYGMETTLFRFSNEKGRDPYRVYSTTLISVGLTTLLFLILSIIFVEPISATIWGDREIKSRFIIYLLIFTCTDAFISIPYGFLRFQKRPLRFAIIKTSGTVINILLNIIFLVLFPKLQQIAPQFFTWYSINDAIDYVLIINVISSLSQLLLLTPQLKGFKYILDRAMLKKMLAYSFPLLFLGLAGIISSNIDKMLFPEFYPVKEDALSKLGIYTMSFKLSIIVALFTQAFRYAFEPFIFARNKEENTEDTNKSYAEATKYFIILGLFMFIGVMAYIDIIKLIFSAKYHESIPVVPIVILGQLFIGVYFNLSLWYKLTDKTKWGAYLAFIGCAITIIINILFIPIYGYMACAWALFISSFSVMTLSYFLGQKYHPIKYDLKSISFFFLLAMVIYICIHFSNKYIDSLLLRLLLNTVLVTVYGVILIKKEIPLKDIPLINKLFKKK